MSDKTTLLIPKIENGIVIDHIPAGCGARLLRILCEGGLCDTLITLGVNYGSQKLVRKDMIKVWARELPETVLQQLSLVAPGVTVKRVTDYEVDKKYALQPPTEIVGLVQCRNPRCITHSEEDAVTRFRALTDDSRLYRCAYCERVFSLSDLQA